MDLGWHSAWLLAQALVLTPITSEAPFISPCSVPACALSCLFTQFLQLFFSAEEIGNKRRQSKWGSAMGREATASYRGGS